MDGEVERVSVEQARQALKSGALLVCAYEDDDKCERNGLEGLLSLRDLEARAAVHDREIIFYCA